MTTFIDELKAVQGIGQIDEKFIRFRSYKAPPERDLYNSVITYVKSQKERLTQLAVAEGKTLEDLLIIGDQKVTFEDWVEKTVLSIEEGKDYTVNGNANVHCLGFLYQGKPVKVKGETDLLQVRYLDNLLSEMTTYLTQVNDEKTLKGAFQFLQKGLQALGHLAQIERAAKPYCNGLIKLYENII